MLPLTCTDTQTQDAHTHRQGRQEGERAREAHTWPSVQQRQADGCSEMEDGGAFCFLLAGANAPF